MSVFFCFFFSSRRRHTRSLCDWSSDVCSSDLDGDGDESGWGRGAAVRAVAERRDFGAGAGDTAEGADCELGGRRSEEHTSELQSHSDLVCRLLLEKKKKKQQLTHTTVDESRTS